MSDPRCTRFEELRPHAAGPDVAADAADAAADAADAATADADADARAAAWREHRSTCAACRAQERADALLREALKAAVPPTKEEEFTACLMARLATTRLGTTPPRRSMAGAHWFLILSGLFVTAAGAAILASLPQPLFHPEALRTLVLTGALISPLVLVGALWRAITHLLGAS
jgi:hypothetical protein